jgi:hypothetical protein
LVIVLANAGKVSAGGTPGMIAYLLKLLLGFIFLFLARRQWQSRPNEGEQPQMPKWMETIDAFSAGRALGLAALLAGVNPKNLALSLAAAVTIAQAGLSGAAPWVALSIFVILGSITVAAPVIYFLMAGETAEKTLNGWKTWLLANNATVMFVLFIVLGVKLIGDGLAGLI